MLHRNVFWQPAENKQEQATWKLPGVYESSEVRCWMYYIFYKIACKRCNKYTMFLFFYSLLITSFKSAEGGKICKLAISYLIFYMELTVLVFSWFKKNKKTKTVELRMCWSGTNKHFSLCRNGGLYNKMYVLCFFIAKHQLHCVC